MTAWLDDGDVRLYHGDALETLQGLPDGSVDCVVTSPPYWGLRDYGTGEWAGGDPDCDHVAPPIGGAQAGSKLSTLGPNRDGLGEDNAAWQASKGAQYRDLCGKCGATRVDQQLGLEPTPDLFVNNMVAVFREIRRVLADHGTVWCNLGDSYMSTPYEPWGLKAKDQSGIPHRVYFALQADGWYGRMDNVWGKPNPMPESVTDRPTKAHEYVFLLTKRPRYWFDAEAVREPHADVLGIERFQGRGGVSRDEYEAQTQGWNGGGLKHKHRDYNPAGRNVRSVWQIATQPYPEAHFATFPEELARRCVLAGCPVRVCRVCGKPSERIVGGGGGEAYDKPVRMDGRPDGAERRKIGGGQKEFDSYVRPHTVGWSDCGHNNWRPGVTLDPFIGSGTVAKVARDHQRHAIGIDLNASYLELAARRLQQLSLLNEATV